MAVKQGPKTVQGRGGETHQQVEKGEKNAVLTTDQGIPVSDNQNSLKSGA